MFTVIIPYFQREQGILSKALRSVFAQRDITSLRVLIVDDQSPISARCELNSFGYDLKFPVTILEQTNAGPGAARNRGLDEVRSDSKYVAFLDSDDEWSEDHLANAFEALEAGYDCYFANFYQLGQSIGAFERRGRIDPQQHPRIWGKPLLHAYRGDMFNQTLTGNIVGTSTVVYNFPKFRNLRFHSGWRLAGEDYLFVMMLARCGASFAFSSKIEAVYGSGVNIYSRSGWGTEAHLLRTQNEMQYRKETKRLFKLSEPQIEFVNQQIGILRAAFSRTLLHRLINLESLNLSVLGVQAKIDPMTFLSLPIVAVKIAIGSCRAKGGGSA